MHRHKLGAAWLVLPFLLWVASSLLAQQPGDPGWSESDTDNGQYAPNPQPDYPQPPQAQPTYPDSGQAYPPQGYGPALTPAQPLNAGQLEQLVAPIALYPDALVAQVLAASTYPGQIADADQWLQAQGYSSPEQVAGGADVESWDPSVKALTAFPRVLAQMDRNLQWTTDLGNAYYNQPQDVLEAVQVMRRRAEAAGTLQNTPQQRVYYDQGYIQLMPADPQVVYVPTYNPWTVYGDAVSPYPGFSPLGALGSFFGSSPVSYGLGIALSAFSHTPWGWLAWGLNWLADTILFNHSDYYSHSNSVADWGFRHDRLHAYAGRGGFGRRGFEHAASGYHGFGRGYDWGRGFNRSPERYAGNWGRNSDHGFHSFGGGYDRNAHQAYNHMQSAGNWRQFDRRQYRSNANRRIGEGYRGGAAYGHSSSQPSYRASNSGFERRDFGSESSRGFESRHSFASQGFVHPERSEGKAQRSLGSNLFGGGHKGGGYEPQRVSSHGSGGFHLGVGGHAPKSFQSGGKSFRGGKSFGGGHSHGGGGHSGGHGGGGKHHH